MFVELSGNGSDEMDRLAATLALGTGGALARYVAAECGEALGDVQDEQFATGLAPDGSPHAPLGPFSRQGTPLFDTGTLRDSAKVMVFGLELEIASMLVQTNVQQYGATIYPVKARALSWVAGGTRYFSKKVTIPARPFVPVQGTLPPRWADALWLAQVRIVPDFLPSSDGPTTYV